MIDWKIFFTIVSAAMSIVFVMALIVIAKERFFKRSPAAPTPTDDRDWPWLVIIGMVAVPLGISVSVVFLTLNYTWRLPLVGDLRTPFLFLGLVLVYLVFCLKTVKENEYGVISFFGYMLKTVDGGLAFVPFLLCRLIPLPASQKTVEIGSDDSEKTSVSEPRDEALGIIRCAAPLSVMFAEKGEVTKESLTKIGIIGLPYWEGLEKNDDPLNGRLKAGLKLTIVVRVARDAAQKFVKRVGSFENAIQQLEKNARGIVDDICTKITWAYFNRHQEEIADCLLGGLESFVADPDHKSKHYKQNPKNTEPWGLDIIEAAVQPSALASVIQAKIDDVTAAREEKISIEIRAAAKKKELQEHGEGNADAEGKMLEAKANGRLNMLTAEANGLAKLIEEYKKERAIGSEILTIKARERVAETADHTIISDDILGPAAIKIKTALDAVSKKGEKP